MSESGRKIASFRSVNDEAGITAPAPGVWRDPCPTTLSPREALYPMSCPGFVKAKRKKKTKPKKKNQNEPIPNRKPLGYFPLQRSCCPLQRRRRRVMCWPCFREELCARGCSPEGREKRFWLFGRALFLFTADSWQMPLNSVLCFCGRVNEVLQGQEMSLLGRALHVQHPFVPWIELNSFLLLLH